MNRFTLIFFITIQTFFGLPCALASLLSIGEKKTNDDVVNNNNSDSNHYNHSKDTTKNPIMIKAIRNANVPCRCGKVQLAIDSPSALRFVCYSKDCRGYFQTLNEQTQKLLGRPPAAVLDAWGGVDLTQIYPSEITVVRGSEHMEVVKIRPESPIRRVYASCCGTPLFDIGTASAMVHSQILPDKDKPDIRFRIIGRHALKGNDTEKRPHISWSIPFSWMFVMGRRMDKAKMEPNPIDISNPKVMENFHQG